MQTAIDRTSDASREIVEALRRRLRDAAARREDRVFAEIRPLRKRVEVFILPGPRQLRGGAGLARRAPRTQGWGWFRTRFDVRSMGEVESAARLILQSYLHGVRTSRGNGRRTVRRRQGL